MRQIRHLGKSVRVIVEHPAGGLLSLPASETSLELTKTCPLVGGKTPLFDPQKLLRLVEWVGTQNPVATQKKSSGQQHKKAVQRKNDATTAPTPKTPPNKIRRPHPALDQSDSAAGFQNARPTTTHTDTQGEPN